MSMENFCPAPLNFGLDFWGLAATSHFLWPKNLGHSVGTYFLCIPVSVMFFSIFLQYSTSLFLKAFWNTVRNASFWFLGLVTFVPLKRKPLQEDHHNFVQIDIDDWWCKDDNAAADDDDVEDDWWCKDDNAADDDDDVEDDQWNDEWKNAEDWGTIVQLSPRQQ